MLKYSLFLSLSKRGWSCDVVKKNSLYKELSASKKLEQKTHYTLSLSISVSHVHFSYCAVERWIFNKYMAFAHFPWVEFLCTYIINYVITLEQYELYIYPTRVFRVNRSTDLQSILNYSLACKQKTILKKYEYILGSIVVAAAEKTPYPTFFQVQMSEQPNVFNKSHEYLACERWARVSN